MGDGIESEKRSKGVRPLPGDRQFNQERISQTDSLNEICLKQLKYRLPGMIAFFRSVSEWIDNNKESIGVYSKNLEETGKVKSFAKQINDLIIRLEKPEQTTRAPIDPDDDDSVYKPKDNILEAIALYASFQFKDESYLNPSWNLSKPEIVLVSGLRTAYSKYKSNMAYLDFAKFIQPERVTNLLTLAASGVKIPASIELTQILTEISPIGLMCNIAQSHEKDIYVKADLIAAIKRAGVNVCEDDREIVKKANVDTDYFYDIEKYIRDSTPYIEARIRLLGNSAIYLKPTTGACGVGVVKIERTENGLKLQAEPRTLDLLELACSGALNVQTGLQKAERFIEKVYLKDKATASVEERFLQEYSCQLDLRDETDLPDNLKSEFYVEGYLMANRDTRVWQPEGGVYNNRNDYPVDFHAGMLRLIKDGKYSTSSIPSEENLEVNQLHDFFSGITSIQCSESKGQRELNIKVAPKDIADVLRGIDQLMIVIDSKQYAEQAINAPKYHNKGFEVRVINFHGSPLAAYCKVAQAEGSVLNNISQDGESAKFEDVLNSVYRNISKSGEHSLLAEKIAWTENETYRLAEVAAKAAAKQVQDAAKMQLSGLVAPQILDKFSSETCSTDFMFEVFKHPDLGDVLKPVLIDSNMFYGFTGLEQVDPSKFLEVKRRLSNLKMKTPAEMFFSTS